MYVAKLITSSYHIVVNLPPLLGSVDSVKLAASPGPLLVKAITLN